MCGRDLIAVAETGSGKTLAYTLPLVRHVLSVKRQYKEYLAKQKEEKLLSLQQQEENRQQQGAAEGQADAAAPSADNASEPKEKRSGKQQAGDNEDKDRYRKNEKGERMLIYGNFKEGMIGLVGDPLFPPCTLITNCVLVPALCYPFESMSGYFEALQCGQCVAAVVQLFCGNFVPFSACCRSLPQLGSCRFKYQKRFLVYASWWT